jgi:L-ribulokinase
MAGQSSFGDVYAMFRRILEFPVRQILPQTPTAAALPEATREALVSETCDQIIAALTREAEQIPLEESTLLATDWINGRRTPDANQLLQGTITGFTLGTKAPQVFRALVEATAYGTKAIVDRFVSEGVHIDSVIGIGGIALKSPFVMQTMSDVLGMPIKVCKTDQACALGAAMFAATAAGVYTRVEEAIAAMNSGFSYEYQPNLAHTEAYRALYAKYQELGQFTEDKLYR